ncbi:MAG: sulfite exporter TauE/SafE family protein [Pseudolabrys sp.]|nr:sulfite exporter TauE/SafE family protein [Pseudolabrys sp.]MCW5683021.1 sulfite exporter TauE/SafE family protein [Pseudolabrys sp.]
MLGVPLSEIAWLVVMILIGGVVTGVLAGLFGIGGGGIIVPVLYEVFRVLSVPEDVRMQLCIGTSLAIIIPTAIRSYRAHAARGAALRDVVRKWTIPSIVGVGIGALTAAVASGEFLKIAFAVIATFVAIKSLIGNDSWQVAKELPGQPAMSGYGFLVGLCASLMGVSGGSVSNAILMLHGVPIHNSVATSAGIGVPITIAGAVGYMLAGLAYQSQMPPLSIGFVSIIGVVLMAPVTSYMAGYGVKLAHWMPRRKLEIAFGIFLLLVSARFVVSAL